MVVQVIPYGWRFNPTDQELVGHYLRNKLMGQPFPMEGVVKECDLYGSKEPWEIFDDQKGSGCWDEKVQYFLTKLKKKTKNGSRIDRTVGSGAWKGLDKGTTIVDAKTKQVIGIKRSFVYENNTTTKQQQQQGSNTNTNTNTSTRWIMKEYSTDLVLEDDGVGVVSSDYVLCRIKKKNKEGSRKRARIEDQNCCQGVSTNNSLESVIELIDLEISQHFMMMMPKQVVEQQAGAGAGIGHASLTLPISGSQAVVEQLHLSSSSAAALGHNGVDERRKRARNELAAYDADAVPDTNYFMMTPSLASEPATLLMG